MPHSRGIIALGAVSFVALLLFLAGTFLSAGDRKTFRGGFGGSLRPQATDWSDFAYVQYVTNLPYLCNSVMLFESLHRLGSKADRLLMYPDEMNPSQDNVEGKLLRKARDEYEAVLQPIEVQQRPSTDCESDAISPRRDGSRY